MQSRFVGSGWLLFCTLGFACVTLRLSSADDTSGPPLELRPPNDASFVVELPKYQVPDLDRAGGSLVFAYEYSAHVYERPSERASTLGIVRRGTALRATRQGSDAATYASY